MRLSSASGSAVCRRCSLPLVLTTASAARRASAAIRSSVPSASSLPGVDDRDAIAEPLGFFHVVRRVDDGAAVAVQRLDVLEDLVARLRIDADRRLVEQQQLGIVHDAPRPG